ncbi:GNAT family N-acetyltransferase [Rubrivirga sp. IMCC45206]|uniref:GNAT family N-acetyltransferase n=1 Tax=Rubrivirga sp. IMCC45206 TaxID=3391614 RepID=UPI00398FE63D
MPSVRRVPAAVVRPLRTAVLRPGWTDRLASYDQDDTVAAHVAAFRDGASEPDGVGTVYAEAPPAELRGEIPPAAYADGAAWRLRGMATSEAARGTGLGRLVLDGCFDAVRDDGGRFLWCNARVGALPFYERLGLAAVGPEFDIPEIGPHFVMWTAV